MNLSTTYMGLKLKSPLVVSASPLSEKLDNILRMEEAGAGAVVMFSLFEEQIQQEQASLMQYAEWGSESFAEALSYFPEVEDYRMSSDHYLDLLNMAASRTDIPIIGSLNGTTEDGWIEYAKLMEEAGAKGIELNVFFIPVDLLMNGGAVEMRYLQILKAVKNEVSIPVAIKLNPYFTSTANMAYQLDQAGADALVLFNRFYEPDFDINTLSLAHSLELSSPSEIRLPLLWLAVLHGRLNASLAATTGVNSSEEVIKYLLAGADTVMTASALLKHGIDYLSTMRDDLIRWMAARDFASVDEVRGIMSQQRIADPSAYERANYIKILGNYAV